MADRQNISFFVRLPNSTELNVTISREATIQDLKKYLEPKTGIPATRIRIPMIESASITTKLKDVVTNMTTIQILNVQERITLKDQKIDYKLKDLPYADEFKDKHNYRTLCKGEHDVSIIYNMKIIYISN